MIWEMWGSQNLNQSWRMLSELRCQVGTPVQILQQMFTASSNGSFCLNKWACLVLSKQKNNSLVLNQLLKVFFFLKLIRCSCDSSLPCKFKRCSCHNTNISYTILQGNSYTDIPVMRTQRMEKECLVNASQHDIYVLIFSSIYAIKLHLSYHQ